MGNIEVIIQAFELTQGFDSFASKQRANLYANATLIIIVLKDMIYTMFESHIKSVIKGVNENMTALV